MVAWKHFSFGRNMYELNSVVCNDPCSEAKKLSTITFYVKSWTFQVPSMESLFRTCLNLLPSYKETLLLVKYEYLWNSFFYKKTFSKSDFQYFEKISRIFWQISSYEKLHLKTIFKTFYSFNHSCLSWLVSMVVWNHKMRETVACHWVEHSRLDSRDNIMISNMKQIV